MELKDTVSVQNIKEIINKAMKLADQFWREAVQRLGTCVKPCGTRDARFAAETIDGPMAVGCEEQRCLASSH